MKIKTVMRCSLSFIFILLLISYALGQTARGKARQAGVILDDEGNPVISAKVTIEYLGEDVRKLEGKTNKKGEWSFLGLGTGRWRISGTADGYIPAAIDVYVRQLERNPKLTLTLKKIKGSDRPIIEDEDSFLILDKGNDLYANGKYAEALAAFEEFLQLNPKAYQSRLNLYNCYREMGEYEKAIEQCNLVLENVSPDEATGKEMAAKALAGIGECYLKQQDMENAQKYFEQSLDTFPDNELIAYNVGEIFFSNQKLDEALRYFTLASQIKPNWSDAFYKLGLVYLNNADYPSAVQNFEKFLTLEDDTDRAASVKNILEQIK